MTYEPTDNRTRPSITRPSMATGNTSSGVAEIAGVAALAFVAMGLLAFGYSHRAPGTETAAVTTTQGQPSMALGATPQTQFRSPGNDTPAAPTSSTTGQGANSGSTGTPVQR